MNDPSNLLLYTELIRFQSDKAAPELRLSISSVDKSKQRNLQALAFSLGLEYEYYLSTLEARITRSDLPVSCQVDIPHSNLTKSSPPQIISGNDDSSWSPLLPIILEQQNSGCTPTDDFGALGLLEGWDPSNFFDDDLAGKYSDWDINFTDQQVQENSSESPESDIPDRSSQSVFESSNVSFESMYHLGEASGGYIGENTSFKAGSGLSTHLVPVAAEELNMEFAKEQEEAG